MRTLTALLVVAAVACAAGGQDDKGDKDRKKMQGDWVLVSAQMDGKAIPEEQVKVTKMTHAQDKATLVSPYQSADKISAKITRVDPSKKPAEMDWVRDMGPGKDKTMMSIYEWVDDDTLRVCFDPACKERPKEFKAPAGSGYILHLWKRSK